MERTDMNHGIRERLMTAKTAKDTAVPQLGDRARAQREWRETFPSLLNTESRTRIAGSLHLLVLIFTHILISLSVLEE